MSSWCSSMLSMESVPSWLSLMASSCSSPTETSSLATDHMPEDCDSSDTTAPLERELSSERSDWVEVLGRGLLLLERRCSRRPAEKLRVPRIWIAALRFARLKSPSVATFPIGEDVAGAPSPCGANSVSGQDLARSSPDTSRVGSAARNSVSDQDLTTSSPDTSRAESAARNSVRGQDLT